ncbi:DNA polymerase III subunit gamma/tau [Polaromonas sp. CG_9.11]|uniref:DNA polymerase III subunit gamma/tau n=1 Tax=Polaromonas sp. CG_9.11 TaxID=2787730 RepID=UPI0018C93863|nr:DNA polymerase III subunit gamma/tau [Polaromonas sp. CG_9.11]MBG6075014.1 DNA polymerase-3 subunit gamma/tau [Polaromonas sp. CG_9.11]
MSYLVLARKYRPKNFSEMVGQSHVVQALGNALGTGRLHHAYLFTGTRGVGKTTVSRILAKSLNCTGIDGKGGITAEPCGVCDACRDIDGGRFVDYTELDAASNRGVDEIAQLLEQAVYKPVVGRFKVFMIDEVHMLTNTAFNAMLKTLEEPPDYLKFVLATTDPQKVPATVLSRCLQFNLRPMAPETVLEHLVQVLALENVSAEPQALRLLSRAARGSMRDALSLTDQAIAFGSGRLDEASVRVMLGSVDRSYVFRLLDALARGDGRTVVETSEVLRLNGLSAASTLEEMATVLQRMAVLQAVPGIGAGDNDTDPEIVETARLARTMPADETQLLYSLCLHGRGELGLAPDEYAGLTMVLLRLLAFKPPGAVVPAAAGVQPVAVRPASGSAAEPVKKSLSEPVEAPVAGRLHAVQSGPGTRLEDTHQVLQAHYVPALPLTVAYESNMASAQTANVPSAMNSEAFAETAKAPMRPSADIGTEGGSLDDAWERIVNLMVAAESIAALTRELALQSQLCGQSESLWTLRVERESLNQAAAREKLQVALQNALAEPDLRLAVELGAVTNTPARRNSAALVERQRVAELLIQNDPFVQDMIREWGARIVPGSIKSVSS